MTEEFADLNVVLAPSPEPAPEMARVKKAEGLEAEMIAELFRDDLRMADRMREIGDWRMAVNHLAMAGEKLKQLARIANGSEVSTQRRQAAKTQGGDQ